MDEHQPNNQDEIDPEYEAIKGKIPGLTESEEESKEEEEETSTEEEESEPEDDSVEEESEDDDKTQDEEPDPEDDESKEKTETKRPEKYIPIGKYTSEKNEWKTERESLTKEIERLQAAHPDNQEDKIREYAEKHDVSEDSVRELLGLLGRGDKKSDEEAGKIIDETVQNDLNELAELRASNAFDKEFSDLALPKLKKLYPNATEVQLNAAKKELEKISTTNEFLSTPLDKIVLASQEELDPVMGVRQTRKGPETGRQAPKRGDTEYTADDFKAGKTSFAKLLDLPVEQQTKIVEKMDLKTYDEFSRYISRNDPVVINRGGRKIKP